MQASIVAVFHDETPSLVQVSVTEKADQVFMPWYVSEDVDLVLGLLERFENLDRDRLAIHLAEGHCALAARGDGLNHRYSGVADGLFAHQPVDERVRVNRLQREDNSGSFFWGPFRGGS